ncbi:hypothetical protein B9Z65_2063 [Elsinoe australis]|uniref:Spindle pole body component n=1 Tax=Elsinoe australis TaxID=40998 RepID=A0A2P7YMX8_9PEZI|nr:hypothetical protein B9Z65_2063 [Elsinoe australis]
MAMLETTDENPFAFVRLHERDFNALGKPDHEAFAHTAVTDSNLSSLPSNLVPGPLRIPDIESFEWVSLEEIGSDLPSQVVANDDRNDTGAHGVEVWTLRGTLKVEHAPKLRSWDSLHDDTDKAQAPVLPLEAGPRIYDAVLPELFGDQEVELDPQFVIDCLLLLGQAQSSPLFARSEGREPFKAYQDGIFRVSGLSRIAQAGIVQDFLNIANQTLLLKHFISEATNDRDPPAAEIALATCLRTILDAQQQRINAGTAEVQTFNKTQDLFKGYDVLLDKLCNMVGACEAKEDDPSVIEAILAIALAGTDSDPFATVYQTVASRVSRPLALQVLASLGLLTSGQTLVDDVENETMFDWYFADRCDGGMDKSAAEYLTAEQHLIRDIRHGLSSIKRSVDQHPLLYHNLPTLTEADLSRRSASVDPDEILARARKYEADLMAELDAGQRSRPVCTHLSGELQPDTSHDIWSADEHMVILGLGSQMSAYPNNNPQGLDTELVQAFEHEMSMLRQRGQPDRDFDINSRSLFEPYLPFLETQSRIVNGTVLRILFRQEHLMDHLGVHHQFHLLRNGPFLKRLQMTLFDSRLPSTALGTSVESNVGIKMDALDRSWPPIDSKMRLTLAGLLTDTYIPAPDKLQNGIKDVPGSLSFSVRDLSDSERTEVLNPISPKAFDFLKLQYHPPPALEAIFTDDVLVKYDDVFRFLLRLIRQSHIAANINSVLTSRLSSLSIKASAVPLRFAHLCQAVIAALTTHFFDLGINVPWSDFTASLQEVQEDLALEDEERQYGTRVTLGISGLASLHDRTLDRVRAGLLLEHKQSALREEIERILGVVLNGSAIVGRICRASMGEEENEYRDGIEDVMTLETEFKDSVRRLRNKLRERAYSLRERVYAHDGASIRGNSSPGRGNSETDEAECLSMLADTLDLGGCFDQDRDIWDGI